MTIHTSHPFADREPDPIRRFRGRMPAPVSVWATSNANGRSGWTVSSFTVIDGDPPRVWGIVDPDEDLGQALLGGHQRLTVNVLAHNQAMIAQVFANLAPSPGGVFATGEWLDSQYGPQLIHAAGRLDVSVEEVTNVGWRLGVMGIINHVDQSDEAPLIHYRGRYVPFGYGDKD